LPVYEYRTPDVENRRRIIMKLNNMLSKLKLAWHSLRMHYHQALMEGCLDGQLKKKLQQKKIYHEMKMIHILRGEAPH
jgi:hypothetical protein